MRCRYGWLALLLTSCKPTPPADAPTPIATTTASAATTDGACARSFPSDAELRAAPEGTAIGIADFFASPPSKGRFTVEGYVQVPHHCTPCPEGSQCKPCEEDLYLSTAKGAYKGPVTDGVDFRIYVHDARKFEALRRYRVTVDVCPKLSTGPEPPHRELRGYRLAD